MNKMISWFGAQPTWLQVGLSVGVVAAVVATGGGLAVALGSAESLVLVAGPVILATGKAAAVVARNVPT